MTEWIIDLELQRSGFLGVTVLKLQSLATTRPSISASRAR
jgi:hypothetical protein